MRSDQLPVACCEWMGRLGAAVAACLAVAALCLVPGCGGGQDDGVVELSVLMSPDTEGTWRQLFEAFNRQHPNIRVKLVEGPAATNSREDQYVTSFLSGSVTYDLVYADVVWIPKFADAGWLEDLTDRLTPQQQERFIAGTIEGSKYNGRIYRVPMQADAGLLYYRKDLLEQAGEQPPQTFDDLVRIASKLQDPGAQLAGFVWQGRQYEGLVCNYLEVLTGFGGTWIDPQTNQVGLDQQPAIDAAEFLRACIHTHSITPPGVTTYAEEESRQIFHSGNAVFLRNWPYVWPLSQRDDSPIRGKVGMVPMPANAGGKHAATLGGWGFAIAKGSQHKEAAWTFIQWITDLPQVQRVHDAYGIVPALKEFYEKHEDPAWKELYVVLQNTVPRPATPAYAQASDILQRHLSAVLTGRSSAEEAMKAAAEQTRALLNR